MNPSFRHRLQQVYRTRLQRTLQESTPQDLQKSTIVFSPHQDDETLGCGGTIIRKKQAGASIKVVYMTDGSGANHGLIDPDQLARIREAEAVAATQILGLTPEDLVFLRFPDGRLKEAAAAAILATLKILETEQPEEIFIPYYRELSFVPDHVATHEIVLTALQKLGLKTVVYEYPIWFWHHYPWIPLPIGQRRGLAAIKAGLKNSWMAVVLGLNLLKDFKCAVTIEAVLDLKRTALDQHKSQMTAFIADPRWTTIADVANGEFLACFFQKQEIFYRYSFFSSKSDD